MAVVGDRHFVVYVNGFSEAFVVAPNHSKARAKVANETRSPKLQIRRSRLTGA